MQTMSDRTAFMSAPHACVAMATEEVPTETAKMLRVRDMPITDEHITVLPTLSLRECSRQMFAARHGTALVLDEQRQVVGMVRSDQILEMVLAQRDISDLTVREVMESQFQEVEENVELTEIAKLIADEQTRSFVVVDKQGHYRGYFSSADLRSARQVLLKVGFDLYGDDAPR